MKLAKRLAIPCILLCEVFIACAPNGHRLRIKTDKTITESTTTAEQDSLTIHSAENETITSVEEITFQNEKATSSVLNLVLLAQEHTLKEEWKEAEKLTVEALKLIENRDLLFMLQKIYQSKNELSKADSCSILIKRFDQ